MSNAVKGYGTILKRGDGGSPEGFSAVAEVKDIGAFGATRTLLECTHYGSPGGFKEFILGLKDGSTFSVVANWIPSDASQSEVAGCMADFNSGATKNYQIIFPTSPNKQSNIKVLVMKFTIKDPIDGVLECTWDFKLTADITWV